MSGATRASWGFTNRTRPGHARQPLDAEDAIDAATFAGDVESSKPAPDLVEAALDKAGVAPEEAMFTSDTVWDAQACRKAAVPCIGLLSGGISRSELTEAGAVQVYTGPADLLAALDSSLLGETAGEPDEAHGG